MLRAFTRWLAGRGRAARLLAEGRAAEARADYVAACERYRAASAAAPRSAAPLLHLGVALESLGKGEAALASFEAAVAVESGNPFARYNVGRARYLRGELDRAETHLRAALASQADFPDAEVVLAEVLEARGDAKAAGAVLEAALARHPGHGLGWRQLGMLRCREERWDEAVAALWRAVAAQPANALSRAWLGGALAEMGEREPAARHFSEALALDPRLAQAHIGLGSLHATNQRYAEAAACYRAAIALEPRNAQAHVNLANALIYLGEAAEARACCDAALALDAENPLARWIRVMAAIPAVREASEDLGTLRRRFGEELLALDQWFDDGRSANGQRAVGVQQPFWLAYHDEDNLALLQTYGRLCARLMRHWQREAGLMPQASAAAGPVRVGIVSQYFRRHAVWEALIRGWLEELDAERFELHAFHLGGGHDAETEFARARAARFHEGPLSLRQWVERILETRPHALIYPEVGMDPMTLKLASLRLAPLQAASWGHPQTTGLPTIDCFLSAQALEPKGAQVQYTERLVPLPGLGCHVRPDALEGVPFHARNRLPNGVPLLICAGTPYKYAPEHDDVFPRIARAAGDCCFVFFVSPQPALSEKLRRRLAAAFRRDGLEFERFVRFLPWMPRAEFHALLREADAMLDTIGFSGFNTALQSIGCGLPVVAYEGRFLRGRLASGMLRHIGMDELVAGNVVDYVALAAKLATDADYRDGLRRRLEAQRGILYGDSNSLRALEEFLRGAVSG